ncbi:MAG: hypothetical protein A2133_12450 [Actinobacteria bacterium RBG_16_64_13]|nr:MAG: hypothetical protein A2133_12450 [Actinobacteria bacterium RBG_16_64_13]
MSSGNTDHASSTHLGTARIAGALFIIATAATLLSLAFLGSVGSPEYLTKIAENEGQVALGVLFRLIAAFASAAIAISLYPVLRRYRQGLALGAVGFRVIEGVFYALGTVSVLLLLTLSQEFGYPDRSAGNGSGCLADSQRLPPVLSRDRVCRTPI